GLFSGKPGLPSSQGGTTSFRLLEAFHQRRANHLGILLGMRLYPMLEGGTSGCKQHLEFIVEGFIEPGFDVGHLPGGWRWRGLGAAWGAPGGDVPPAACLHGVVPSNIFNPRIPRIPPGIVARAAPGEQGGPMTPHILRHDHGETLVVAWVWPDGRFRLAQYDLVHSVELTPAEFEQVTSLHARRREALHQTPLSGLPHAADGGIMPTRKE